MALPVEHLRQPTLCQRDARLQVWPRGKGLQRVIAKQVFDLTFAL